MIKIRGLDNPATVGRTEKEKLAFSLEQYRRLETEEISRATYMKSMGHIYMGAQNKTDH
jgi:hypothetical protein